MFLNRAIPGALALALLSSPLFAAEFPAFFEISNRACQTLLTSTDRAHVKDARDRFLSDTDRSRSRVLVMADWLLEQGVSYGEFLALTQARKFELAHEVLKNKGLGWFPQSPEGSEWFFLLDKAGLFQGYKIETVKDTSALADYIKLHPQFAPRILHLDLRNSAQNPESAEEALLALVRVIAASPIEELMIDLNGAYLGEQTSHFDRLLSALRGKNVRLRLHGIAFDLRWSRLTSDERFKIGFLEIAWSQGAESALQYFQSPHLKELTLRKVWLGVNGRNALDLAVNSENLEVLHFENVVQALPDVRSWRNLIGDLVDQRLYPIEGTRTWNRANYKTPKRFLCKVLALSSQ